MMRFLLTTCAVLVLGCTSAPNPDVENSPIALAAAGEPIRFLTDAEPLDVSEPTGGELTLQSVLKRAILHDPSIQAALARVRQAQADAKQARLLPNPILDLAIRYPERGGDPIVEASLAADLLSLLRRPREIRSADHTLQATCAQALLSVLDTAESAQSQYILAQSLEAEMALLDKRRELTSQLISLAESRQRAGEASQLDVLTVQSELASLESEYLEKAGEHRAARLALARMLGQPSGDVEFALLPWQPPAMSQVDEKSWIQAALAHRPEIQAYEWELAALGEQSKSASLSMLEETSIGATAEHDEDWSVGPAISVPLPIFDFGQANRARLSAQRIEARHQLNQARRQVVQEVRTAMVELSSSQAALASVESTLLPLHEKLRQQAQEAYKLGLADITTVRLAEQEFQSSRARQIELQRKVAQNHVRLLRASGGLPPATNESSPR